MEEPMSIVHRILAVLTLSPKALEFIAQATIVVDKMTNNPDFPDPSPVLTVVSDHIQTMQDAQLVALSRARGAAEARDHARRVVLSDLRLLQAYVQSVADANPHRAATIITGAGMTVKNISLRQRNQLDASQGDLSGHVELTAACAGRKAIYMWQWSVDQVVWNDLPMTFDTKTGMTGLTPVTRYYFRYRTFTKSGEGDWSQIVSLLVL
jgi:hypothetical protein